MDVLISLLSTLPVWHHTHMRSHFFLPSVLHEVSYSVRPCCFFFTFCSKTQNLAVLLRTGLGLLRDSKPLTRESTQHTTVILTIAICCVLHASNAIIISPRSTGPSAYPCDRFGRAPSKMPYSLNIRLGIDN